MKNSEMPDGVVEVAEKFSIANEFTGAWVRKVWTRNGERLEVSIPKTGNVVYLDAMQLEIIARQSPASLARFNAQVLQSEFDPES
ncbi:MAG TPA: hypothetical protein VNT00_04410 [Eoetvoesiella sp.]|jgi:hypothetical protein|uniref:hypothetical protein n=1 Tax=Eoetvoesiella sp. TaxID=1966355 RepID=UPI002C130F31|nr:hypothetical protein [Eoetvoesiella sp.]HWK60642.1 hypothetical protein [Eoetvoesiella sp.]